jgi:hypothetical protein
MGYGSIALTAIGIFFLSLNHKSGTAYTGWKFTLIKFMCYCSARLTLLAVGIFYIDEEKVDFDYKKYLGPDWKENKNA